MRKLLILICFFISAQLSAQVYQIMPQYGYQTARMRMDSVLLVPGDTIRNKSGVARIGTQLYAGNGSYWTRTGGSDSSVLFTNYRADTMRNNIYSAIGNVPIPTLQQAFDAAPTANPQINSHGKSFILDSLGYTQFRTADTTEDANLVYSRLILDPTNGGDGAQLTNTAYELSSGIGVNVPNAVIYSSNSINSTSQALWLTPEKVFLLGLNNTDTSYAKLAIGTQYPAAPLHVIGSPRFQTDSAQAGYVWTSKDTNGQGEWRQPQSATTIYTGDGTITGSRTVYIGSDSTSKFQIVDGYKDFGLIISGNTDINNLKATLGTRTGSASTNVSVYDSPSDIELNNGKVSINKSDSFALYLNAPLSNSVANDDSLLVINSSGMVKKAAKSTGADSSTYFTTYRADTMRSNLYANKVPYTGATQDVDLGAHKLGVQAINVNGTNGNGNIHFKHQANNATATGQSTSLFADSNGDLKWKNDGEPYVTLQTNHISLDRTYRFPDSTGTVALLSNVATKLNITDTANMRVRLTAGTGIGITGTYPNLTINGTDTTSLSNRINAKANTAGSTFTDSLVLTSTVGGFTLPRMTQTQMNAIIPRVGTQVYNTTYDAVCTYTNDFGWWSNEQPWISSNGWMVNDEFITYAYANNQNGNFFQIQNSNGTWTSATPLSNRPGILTMSTGTNATARLTVQADGIGLASNIVGGGKLIYETDVQIPTLSSSAQTFSFFTGLNSVNTNVSTNSIAFLYDSAGVNTGSAAIGRWQVVCANGSTRSYTTTDSTVTAGRWYRLRAEVNAAGNSVAFYINGTLVKTETNNIPTGALTYVSSLIKSNGTTARTAWVDFIRIRQKFTTPR